ncbi:DUF6207 family protein [Streptomyces acidicola]|uniref:DUF6207 family protein n=1 Tax=Streptomyces acidicola TaxID=2596892 RepID=UPI003830B505
MDGRCGVGLDRWTTATAQHTTRDAGEPGVWLRFYLDLRQPISPAAPAEALSLGSAGRPR